MKEDILKRYNEWLNSPKVTPEDKEILKGMNEAQLDDAFFKDIEFGTGGLRGVIGPGTNRINTYLVDRITYGFGLYLIETFGKEAKKRGVVISHDNRHMSREFTLKIAKTLNSIGINTYIFSELRPTPELSFAVRELHTIAGIMITASHNPKEYNGYKVYDERGCQYIPEIMDKIIAKVNTLPSVLNVKIKKSLFKGKNVVLGDLIDKEYNDKVLGIQLRPELDKKDFKIIYTPNHGASLKPVMSVLTEAGYNVINVKSTSVHDPDFGAVESPNPEDAVAYKEPIEIATKEDADLVLMTDPDGDRVGLAVRTAKGKYELMTGNESAALLVDYILEYRKEKGILSANDLVVSTVVTSSLGGEICDKYGIKYEEVLTGFKFIGDKIKVYEAMENGPHYIFGYEESYGCLIEPFVRDKDATQACLLYAEMCLYYKHKGMNLVEAYANLCKDFGFHKSKLFNIYFKGSDGAKKMNDIIASAMANPFKELAGKKVRYVKNYKTQKCDDLLTNETTPIVGLPKTNLIKFVFEDKSSFAIRPSGTEPKCKFYIEVVENDVSKINAVFEEMFSEFKKLYKID